MLPKEGFQSDSHKCIPFSTISTTVFTAKERHSQVADVKKRCEVLSMAKLITKRILWSCPSTTSDITLNSSGTNLHTSKIPTCMQDKIQWLEGNEICMSSDELLFASNSSSSSVPKNKGVTSERQNQRPPQLIIYTYILHNLLCASQSPHRRDKSFRLNPVFPILRWAVITLASHAAICIQSTGS